MCIRDRAIDDLANPMPNQAMAGDRKHRTPDIPHCAMRVTGRRLVRFTAEVNRSLYEWPTGMIRGRRMGSTLGRRPIPGGGVGVLHGRGVVAAVRKGKGLDWDA